VPPRRASLPSATVPSVTTTSNRVAPLSYWRTCTTSLPSRTPPEHERPQLVFQVVAARGGSDSIVKRRLGSDGGCGGCSDGGGGYGGGAAGAGRPCC